MVSHVSAQRGERISALILRRIQASGAEGITASEIGAMVVDELGGAIKTHQDRAAKMMRDGKIFGKLVPKEKGGVQNRFFFTQPLSDAFTSPLARTEDERAEHRRTYQRERERALRGPKVTKPLPKGTPKVATLPFEARPIIIPEGIVIQTLPGFQGDYRIQVDPATCPRRIDSTQCREWAKA